MGAPESSVLLVIAAVALPLRALTDLAQRDFPDRDTRAMWVLAVLLLVIIGPLVYFVIGRSLGVREDSWGCGGSSRDRKPEESRGMSPRPKPAGIESPGSRSPRSFPARHAIQCIQSNTSAPT